MDFQPLYKHNPRKTDQLQIGAEILRERQSQEAEKDRRAATSKLGSKDAAAAAAEKVIRISQTLHYTKSLILSEIDQTRILGRQTYKISQG